LSGIVLHPLFDSKLGSIRFDYASSYGEIHSAWQVHDAIADWQLTLPPTPKDGSN
jgi:alpha-L-rhamnosidase